MSESLSSLYSPYFDEADSVIPEFVGPRDAFPSYMPRAEITFPAFAALPDMYEAPPAQEQPMLRPAPAAALPPSGGGFSGLPDNEVIAPEYQGANDTGDKFGFGSTPFITNTDSDNVFDSIGNIFTDGGDTSDWIDVGYNAARMFGGFAEGGLVDQEPMAFAEGGLVPLAGGGKIAIGPGGGLDDLIPTSINGRRAAALSDGEFVVPADVVSMMGDGSSNAGARRLYDLVRQIREAKTGTNKQAGPLPVGTILKRSLR